MFVFFITLLWVSFSQGEICEECQCLEGVGIFCQEGLSTPPSCALIQSYGRVVITVTSFVSCGTIEQQCPKVNNYNQRATYQHSVFDTSLNNANNL